VLLGDHAPAAGDAPLRVGLEARLALGDALALTAGVEALLSGTPSIAVGADLAPIEPRAWFGVGVAWRLPAIGPRGGGRADGAIAAAAPGAVAIRVEANGGPVAGATVAIDGRTIVTDADGEASLADLPPGDHAIEVRPSGGGLRPGAATVAIAAGGRARVVVTLEHDLPPGQLRGVIRSTRGAPVAATLTLAPGGHEVRCGADGRFQLDVPPGPYQVTIAASGHKPQTRAVVIEQDGVTILNVDLAR
jgi:hypothetical protein